MNDGGPAFPCVSETGAFRPQGMSLRDWFAGQALTGMMATATLSPSEEIPGLNTAMWAYKYADAMLAAREREST